jgi:trehalose/maltose hydrolase-like predicted phosphorylase
MNERPFQHQEARAAVPGAGPWMLAYDGFDPDREGLREALCALGNGLFVTRGAAEEARADDVHYPGTYVAGGYNRLASEVAGRTVVNEDLVNFPNWLPITFRPEDGDWLDLRDVEILSYRQELRLREGVLVRRFRVRDAAGRETRVETRRLVSMAYPHLAAIDYRLTPQNWRATSASGRGSTAPSATPASRDTGSWPTGTSRWSGSAGSSPRAST